MGVLVFCVLSIIFLLVVVCIEYIFYFNDLVKLVFINCKFIIIWFDGERGICMFLFNFMLNCKINKYFIM